MLRVTNSMVKVLFFHFQVTKHKLNIFIIPENISAQHTWEILQELISQKFTLKRYIKKILVIHLVERCNFKK